MSVFFAQFHHFRAVAGGKGAQLSQHRGVAFLIPQKRDNVSVDEGLNALQRPLYAV